MNNIKSIWLIFVYLVPFAAHGHRIVKLLNEDESRSNGNEVASYRSNAHARGFSIVDEDWKNVLINPTNIIQVRILDRSDSIPETENILMIREQESKVQRPTKSIHNEKNSVTKTSSKPGKFISLIYTVFFAK